jgi:phosphoglycerate dehydrogenase-like enzyme
MPSQGDGIADDAWERVRILYTAQQLPYEEQAPDLRWIQFYLAGIDKYIDDPVLQRPNLVATTLSGANAPQVAEHALALMLALGHNLPSMFADQSRNHWPNRRLERYQPKELQGSTVGVIGLGSIGRHLAMLLQSFDCTVLGSKRNLLEQEEPGYSVMPEIPAKEALVERLYPSKAMGAMLKECDYVVVAAPLTPETEGLVGADAFEAMKDSAFLVDVSRGGVTDHEALLAALDKGRIAGAALDVFPEEPLPADSPLWESANVIISPHVAGLSPHYNERAFALLKENLRRYLSDEELFNLVDPQRGY